jgi:hypothetical protein
MRGYQFTMLRPSSTPEKRTGAGRLGRLIYRLKNGITPPTSSWDEV